MHKPCAEWHSTLSPSVFIALIKATAILGCLGYTLPPGGNPATGSEVRLQGEPKRTNRRKRRFVRFLIVTVFQESIQTLDGYRPAPVEKKRIFYTGTPFLPPTCQEKWPKALQVSRFSAYL